MSYAAKAQREEERFEVDTSVPLPSSWDWRDHGVVSSVKDQGQCGSCWTFAAAETVESHMAIKTGRLTDLSEQQILDCTPNPQHCGGTGGCQGGIAELAYAQIMVNGGLSSEWTYPYISYSGQNYNCQFSGTTPEPMIQLSNYTVLPSNQQLPVLKAVSSIGPLAVAVDASLWSTYETGVFDGCNYNDIDIDHAVVLVGYGTDPNFGDYYLIRNSWSPTWGEKGYIRLKRNATPTCGTDPTPADGTACSGGPSSVTVCGTCGVLYDVCFPIIA
jgi:cathepsin L